MRKIANILKERLKTIQELMQFIWENKIWWLTPVFIVLALIGILIIFTAGNPAATPFIYTLF